MSITTYFKETRAELKHVAWPSRRQIASYTAIVIGISLVIAAFLGAVDYLLNLGLGTLIS